MRRKAPRRTFDNSAKRGGAPIRLDYDPLDNAESMHKFLNQLIGWTLSGRIKPRVAATCRAVLATSLDVQGYGELAKKANEIDELLEGTRQLFKQATMENPTGEVVDATQ